jgi:hypothetical protein
MLGTDASLLQHVSLFSHLPRAADSAQSALINVGDSDSEFEPALQYDSDMADMVSPTSGPNTQPHVRGSTCMSQPVRIHDRTCVKLI